MKKVSIFEPAMCCSTGLCGIGVDPELLRISTILNTFKKNDIEIERFNLTSAPQEFLNNKAVNVFINTKGVEELPVTVVDDEIVLAGRYPSNEEFVQMLELPKSFMSDKPKAVKSTNSVKGARIVIKKASGCGCSDGNCC